MATFRVRGNTQEARVAQSIQPEQQKTAELQARGSSTVAKPLLKLSVLQGDRKIRLKMYSKNNGENILIWQDFK